jgi:HK97 family phage major capsid protein
MLLQSTPDIEAIIRADLASIIATEVDRASIAGTGLDNQPTGILGTSGIASVAIGANGGPITWTHILQLEEALANASADMGAMAYLTNSKVRRALKAAASSNVPSNLTKGTSVSVCSATIFGNWQDLLIGQWGGLDLMVDKFTNGTSGGTRVIALLDVDIAVRRAASFAAILDATTA